MVAPRFAAVNRNEYETGAFRMNTIEFRDVAFT